MQDFPLGAEGSGLVVALGPDAGGGLQLGQRVAVNGAAAFSEFVVARPSLVTPLVEGVGCAEGAALVLSGVTACAALEATARVRPGEVVAVTAAAGGTGHLAVQLAAAAGATVVGIVGGGTANKKAEAVAALGAHHVIDRTSQDVASELARLFPGGVDVVYDGVGGALRDQLLGCLGPTGRLLQVGYISEYPHTQAYRWDQRDGGDGDDGGGDGGREGGGGCSRPPGNVALDEAEVPAASTAAAAAAAASTAPTAAPTSALPPSEQLFWGGVDVSLGQRRVIGQIWPKDLKAILRCRRRVFDLAARGQLRVLTDQGHGRKGVEGVADAVDYMLRGEHVGKVIIEI
ncbi:hypothetical protein PLESTM_001669800 [Pleodorina starrii]|nr:hypothetical protein PLESTM_001669800 [Pleodorina starrii]